MTQQKKYDHGAFAKKRNADVSKDEHERRERKSERDRRQYLDNRQAAEYLSVSESFLNKTRHFGTGPRFYRVGRAIRYAAEDLDEWMAERCATSTRDYLNGGKAT